MAPYRRVIECTAYCSCGYCCKWEWGLKLPGSFYVGVVPGWMPLRIKRRKKGWVDSPIPLFAKYWTDTTLKGGPYHGFTANGRYPAQSRPPILSPLSLSQIQKIPGRLLLFPWRLLPRHGTIAADTAHYPFGTQMFIPGYGWGIVDDKGSAIRGATRIDLYHYSHNEALHWGRRRVNVLVVPPGESVVDLLHVPKPFKFLLKGLNWARRLLV
ncbi:unnamed protein product [Closterium sp. NIES-53]